MPFGARPPLADNSAVELRVAATIEVDEVLSRRSPRRVGRDEVGEDFLSPFACVCEHTRFAEATEMNRVR